jgi:hypothetical protein
MRVSSYALLLLLGNPETDDSNIALYHIIRDVNTSQMLYGSVKWRHYWRSSKLAETGKKRKLPKRFIYTCTVTISD